MKKPHQQNLLKRIKEVIYAVIYGYLLVAFLQGLLIYVGFSLFKVNAALLLSILVMLLTFIPFVGPIVVWVPVALFRLLSQNIFAGVVIIILGMVVTFIDTFLKPKIIGDRGNVHPILVLLGVLGGLRLFGLIGVIVGPVLLALFVTFIAMYEEGKIHF